MTKNSKKGIGQTIKGLRKVRGISQMELAEKINVSYQQIQKYEKGVSSISVDRLKQIARALNVPTSSFFMNDRDVVAETPAPYGKMTDDEQQLLQMFREIRDKRLKRALLEFLRSIAK